MKRYKPKKTNVKKLITYLKKYNGNTHKCTYKKFL